MKQQMFRSMLFLASVGDRQKLVNLSFGLIPKFGLQSFDLSLRSQQKTRQNSDITQWVISLFGLVFQPKSEVDFSSGLGDS